MASATSVDAVAAVLFAASAVVAAFAAFRKRVESRIEPIAAAVALAAAGFVAYVTKFSG